MIAEGSDGGAVWLIFGIMCLGIAIGLAWYAIQEFPGWMRERRQRSLEHTAKRILDR